MAVKAGSIVYNIAADVAYLKRDLNQATNEFQKFSKSVNSTVSSISFGLVGGLSFAGVIAGLQSCSREAEEAEKAIRQLNTTLASMGTIPANDIQPISDSVRVLAKQLMDLTGFTDEEILRGMSRAFTAGIGTKDIEAITTASANLARHYNMELEPAMQMVIQAYWGQARGIGKLIPEIKGLIKEGASGIEIVEKVNEVIGPQAQAQMETYAGKVLRIQNEYRELKEQIGFAWQSLVVFTAEMAKGILAKPAAMDKKYFEMLKNEAGSYKDKISKETKASIILARGTESVKPPPEKEKPDTGKINELLNLTERLKTEISKIYDSEYIQIEKLAEAYKKKGIDALLVEEWRAAKVQALWDKEAAEQAKIEQKYEEQSIQAQIDLEKKWWDEQIAFAEYYEKLLAEISLKQFEDTLAKKKEQYQAAWDSMMELANTAGGDYGMAAGTMVSGAKGIADIATGQDEKLKASIEQYWAYYNEVEALQWEGADTSEAINNLMLSKDQLMWQTRVSYARAGFQTLAGMAQAYYALSKGQSESAFKLYKAFAIAETIIATYQAAMAAYAWGSKWGGPAGGAAMAAIATAAGMMRVAAIASQEMTGTTAAPVASGAGGYTVSQPEAPQWQEAPISTQRNQQVNFYIYGNVYDEKKLAREIIPYITEAQSDGVR